MHSEIESERGFIIPWPWTRHYGAGGGEIYERWNTHWMSSELNHKIACGSNFNFLLFLFLNETRRRRRRRAFTSPATGRPGCAHQHSATGRLLPGARPVQTQTSHNEPPAVFFHIFSRHRISKQTHIISSSAFDNRLDVDAQLLLTSTLHADTEKRQNLTPTPINLSFN